MAIFESVRDIPYGYTGSRDPYDVLKRGKGSCSGKHLLLGYLFEANGFKVNYMMCLTRFNLIGDVLPEKLSGMMVEDEIYDYHNYLQVYVDRWLDVDATFDIALKEYGLTVNSDWDATSDCAIAFPPLETKKVDNLIEEKVKAIDSLTEHQQQIRERFLQKFSLWMDSIRYNKE